MLLERRGRGFHQVEKQIYAYRKIRAVHESGILSFHFGPDFGNLLIPSGRADNHVLAGPDAGMNVLDDTVGSGEVYDRIERGEAVSRKRARASVIGGAQYFDVMAALARDLRGERTGLACAEEENFHA
jgi:hypothetical protein